MTNKKPKHPDSKFIEALGGTTAVARLCRCESPSVSEWKAKGIPKARRQYLELLRPDVFANPPVSRKRAA